MISFLAPAALIGSLLLAIPILVHLFKPRKVRVTPFSSLRWLHLTQQRLSRRIKWHQILLFLLRAGFVSMLVLALARPMLSPRGKGGVSERFIVLDVSRSMGYQTEGRQSPIEMGKQIAGEILLQGMSDDRTAVLLAGSTTRVLSPLTKDAESHLTALRAVKPTLSETNIGSSMEVISAMLADRRPAAGAEIFVITDNHQNSWPQASVADFLKHAGVPAESVSVKFIDVGVVAAQNAWIASVRTFEAMNPARRIIRVQVGCIGDAGQKRTVRLTGLPGTPPRNQPVTLDPGKLSTVDFELPGAFDTRGKVALISLDPADALPTDDQYFLNLDVRGALKVLLVEGDSTVVAPLRPGVNIRAAVRALSAAAGGSLELDDKTASVVSARDILDADVIFLANVPELSDVNTQAIEQRVRSGGGLAVFLGPLVKPEYYNTRLFKAGSPTASVMPATIAGAPMDPRRAPLMPIAGVTWEHPLLAPLFDPVYGDLGQVRFGSHYTLESPPGGNSSVLARVGDETPAIVEHAFGAGRVVLFNTSANDEWSDLPRRKSFVPLVDRLVSYLTVGGVQRSFEVDESVTLSLGEVKPAETISVQSPSGVKLTPQLRTSGGRTIMQLDPVQEVGVYRVVREASTGSSSESSTPKPAAAAAPGDDKKAAEDKASAPIVIDANSLAFVVNAGRGDSILVPTDTTAIQRWWEPSPVEVFSGDNAAKNLLTRISRVALWPWAVVIGCLCLLAEFFFVHWLCPRMNPNIAESVIHRRGMLRTSEVQSIGTPGGPSSGGPASPPPASPQPAGA